MNPFITGFPATPNVFVGRAREIEFFQKALEQTCTSKPATPQNTAITGGWGIGKTSLLNKCLAMATNAQCLVVKTTLSPEKCKSMEEFAINTIDALHQAIWKHEEISAKIKNQFSHWKIDGFQLLGVQIKNKKENSSTASTILTRKIVEFWEYLRNTVPAIVLAYDDLQYLSRFCPNGLYDLRAIFQDTREAGVRAMLMITGDTSLFANIRGISEPLLRFFEQIQLGPFCEQEAIEALHLPLKIHQLKLVFEKKVMDTLFEKTQKHPYFLNFLAHDLFEYKSSGRVTLPLFQRVFRNILEHLAAVRFLNDIAITSETERELLYNFCQKETLSSKDVEHFTNPGLLFKRLEEKSLLIKIRRGYYQIYHPLFREYLLSTGRI